jgi:hypothetical protein
MTDLLIRKAFELTATQAQAIMDLEAQCADLWLQCWILCKRCKAIGDNENCEGDAVPHADGSMTFSVKCDCTNRAYRGYLVAPTPPRPLRHPRVNMDVKPEVALTGAQMKTFQHAADALHQLQLAYGMRCMACRMEDRDSDGVWGARETNASQFVVECACTKRIYKGADVKLT